MKNYFGKMRGTRPQRQKKPLSEIFWAWLGSFLGIYGVWLVNRLLGLQGDENLYLVGSFGASAVLIYGAPASDFSQPRNFFGGHLLSAAIGVSAAMLLPGNIPLAAAFAVSLAVAVMVATHTTHPPGGATALIGVIGGPTIHELGYMYLLSPVLVGALIMFTVAVIVNNLAPGTARAYPRHWT